MKVRKHPQLVMSEIYDFVSFHGVFGLLALVTLVPIIVLMPLWLPFVLLGLFGRLLLFIVIWAFQQLPSSVTSVEWENLDSPHVIEYMKENLRD